MALHRPKLTWFRVWLLGGVLWLIASLLCHEMTESHGTESWRYADGTTSAEQEQRRDRISTLRSASSVLSQGSLYYFALGVALVSGRRFQAFFVGGAVVFASNLLLGWTMNDAHLGDRELHPLRVVSDLIATVMFSFPLWIVLFLELRRGMDHNERRTNECT